MTDIFKELERFNPKLFAEMRLLAQLIVDDRKNLVIAYWRETEKMPEGRWICPHRTCDHCWNSAYDKREPDPKECSAIRAPLPFSTYNHLS